MIKWTNYSDGSGTAGYKLQEIYNYFGVRGKK